MLCYAAARHTCSFYSPLYVCRPYITLPGVPLGLYIVPCGAFDFTVQQLLGCVRHKSACCQTLIVTLVSSFSSVCVAVGLVYVVQCLGTYKNMFYLMEMLMYRMLIRMVPLPGLANLSLAYFQEPQCPNHKEIHMS